MKSRQTLLSTTLCIAVLVAVPAADVVAQTVTEPDAQAGAADAAGQVQDADTDSADTDSPSAGNIDGDIAQSGDDPQASPGRFIPSEELSRDLGASFPVDI